MKLQVLAVAVAASFAFPLAAQAELNISGDVTVAYDSALNGGDGAISENGSEINFDGSSEVGGVTYMGHAELDFQGSRTSPKFEEVRVGAKGGFGEVWLGDVDNAVDQFDPDSNDIWLGGHSDAFGGHDNDNILYKNTVGAAEFALSHNPGYEETAIGARFGMGPVKVNLGYEDGVTTSAGPDESLLSYGVEGSFGDVTLSAEGNDDDKWGLNASYSAGNNTIWADYGDDGSNDVFGLGYRMSHGQMDYIVEYADDGTDDRTMAGMRYRF
ncbi:MAG: porin [Thiolinea sp.]